MILKIIKASATWCAPCRQQAVVFEKIKPSFPDVDFVEMDIDEQSDLAQKMNVRAVPTIIFEKDGVIVETLVGLQKEQVIVNAINKWK